MSLSVWCPVVIAFPIYSFRSPLPPPSVSEDTTSTPSCLPTFLQLTKPPDSTNGTRQQRDTYTDPNTILCNLELTKIHPLHHLLIPTLPPYLVFYLPPLSSSPSVTERPSFPSIPYLPDQTPSQQRTFSLQHPIRSAPRDFSTVTTVHYLIFIIPTK